MIRQPLLPVTGNQSTFGERVDVARQRQRHHVGLLVAIDDFGCLPSRTAVRLLDLQGDTRLLTVLVDESFVDRRVKLPCRVVGNVENLVRRIVVMQVVHRDQRCGDDDCDNAEGIQSGYGKTPPRRWPRGLRHCRLHTRTGIVKVAGRRRLTLLSD
jgi:hypothetical protein